jgi:hypothetical protein
MKSHDATFIQYCIDSLDHLTDPGLLERWFSILSRTVAVDFDATLHPYTDGWVGSTPADEAPILGARDFLANLKITHGYHVVVFSTRANHDEGKVGIENWLIRYGLDRYVDNVTCNKPPAFAYVDDRAVPFQGDWIATMAGVIALAGGRAHGGGVNK